MAALAIGWIRSGRDGTYPFLQVGAAMVAAFLLFSKVHSPQYTLWILPFFALTTVNVAWWVAYTVVDLAVYIGVFRWFFDFLYRGEDFTFFKKLMIAGVWARAGLLVLLFVAFLLARRPEPQPQESAESPSSLSPRPLAEKPASA